MVSTLLVSDLNLLGKTCCTKRCKLFTIGGLAVFAAAGAGGLIYYLCTRGNKNQVEHLC